MQIYCHLQSLFSFHLSSHFITCPHSSPFPLTCQHLPSHANTCPHMSPLALTCPHMSPFALTGNHLSLHIVTCPHRLLLALTCHHLPSHVTTCPHMLTLAFICHSLPSHVITCTSFIHHVFKFTQIFPYIKCHIFSAIHFNNILLLLLWKKVASAIKAGWERLTPYQSEDPSPTIPSHRMKEEKGKQ